jgi:hypothetical protein
MKLDIFTHIFPPAYFDKRNEVVKDKGALKRWFSISTLHDIEKRLAMVARHADRRNGL